MPELCDDQHAAGRAGQIDLPLKKTGIADFEMAEQMLAEATGKEGKGLVPAPAESAEGADRQWHEVRLPSPYELGQEFFRWEFATAVASSLLGVNPFNQPDVQASKDRTLAVLDRGDAELDEGNIFEALLEGWKHDVRTLWWVVDYNRHSLDGTVNDLLFQKITNFFQTVGHFVGGVMERVGQAQIYQSNAQLAALGIDPDKVGGKSKQVNEAEKKKQQEEIVKEPEIIK